MKKSKFLKTLGFSCMAVFMGSLTILGGCTTNLSTNNGNDLGANQTFTTTGLGLDPKNDPVIYTTESGIEIKYGGLDIEGTLGSGALKGYPYFTMGTYDNKPVNWVIIGRANDVTQNVHINGKESLLFSTWKNTSRATLSNYFMNNIFESTTPAGAAINAAIASKSYVVDDKIITTSLSSIKNTAEIDSGCVLALSEGALGSSVYAATPSPYTGSTLANYCEDLYEENLGLTTTEQNLIKPKTLKSGYLHLSPLREHLQSGEIPYHMFILAQNSFDTNWNFAGQNFLYETYLSFAQMNLSSNSHVRTTCQVYQSKDIYYFSASAGKGSWMGGAATESLSVRPAMVISVS